MSGGGGGAQLPRQAHNLQVNSQSYKIITQYGDMLVVKQTVQHAAIASAAAAAASAHSTPSAASGANASSSNQTTMSHEQQQQQQQQARPVLMTFHDLGLNSELQFASFCECDEVKLMLQTFTLLHVNFIGQEFEQQPQQQQRQQPCESLPDDFKYPSVEQLAECIVDVCAQLRVRSFVALAVGAGAHIVSSLALMRPDLVHGLFLINPIIASCSITEWLYFKMSAIASNRHHAILGGSSGGSGGASESIGTPDQPDASPSISADQPHQHHHQSSGLRKLWGHLHHSHGAASSARASDESAPASSPVAAAASTTESPKFDGPAPMATSGSRLRQLILSRNFRMTSTGSQRARANVESASLMGSSSTSTSASSSKQGSHEQAHKQRRPPLEYLMYHHFGSVGSHRYRRPSEAHEVAAASSRAATMSGESCNQDGRRDSSAASSLSSSRRSSHGSSCGSLASAASDSSRSAQSPSARAGRRPGQEAAAATATAASAAPNSTGRSMWGMGAGSTRRSGRRGRPGTAAAKQQEECRQQQRARHKLERSNSLCLTASHLASFSSERQRIAYMQSVYKSYFQQLNAHNLWLFAQSFVKRHTLNLRKDCGAAAHAAAAAAALGTSICTAFVGGLAASAPENGGQPAAVSASSAGPAPNSPAAASQALGARNSASGADGPNQAANSKPKLDQQQQQQQAKSVAPAPPPKPQALVAGTKVKRTFTCQTLIMCSSVQTHCERALKLMSLLNPLQATWIKTDQLLVLEEKPEKVCQALRLFLQGIGYSMSTYERRLRLSSAQASVSSSADSTGSARSLNLVGASPGKSGGGGGCTDEEAAPVVAAAAEAAGSGASAIRDATALVVSATSAETAS